MQGTREYAPDPAERDEAAGTPAGAGRQELVTDLFAKLHEFTGTDHGNGENADTPLYLSSLSATALRTIVEHQYGVDLPLDFPFGHRTMAEVADAVARAAPTETSAPPAAERLTPQPAKRFEPFPLTDIQQAYWLGGQGFELGGRSAHFYLELDLTAIPLERIEQALRQLIAQHDMLRAVVREDGSQQVLRDPGPPRVRHRDLSGLPAAERDRALAATRDEMAQQTFDPTRWPLYDVRAHTLEPDVLRLHLSIDLLFIDAESIRLLLSEWIHLALDAQATPVTRELSFRDYAEASLARRDSAGYAKARDYWLGRLHEIPAAPELPVVPEITGLPDFARYQFDLGPEEWRRFRQHAEQLGVTPSILLCAAYSAVLRTWSKTSRFTVNVTTADRPFTHPDLRTMLGDFTTTILLDCDLRDAAPLGEVALRLQRQLHLDLQHAQFSGVQVQRELARSGATGRSRMPVVFTSLVGADTRGVGDLEGIVFTERFAVSQTPQVYLDNQVVTRRGGLSVSWDTVPAMFSPGVLEDMFAAYRELLTRLSEESAAPRELPCVLPLPEEQQRVRERVNDTAGERPEELIHEAFDRQVAVRGGAPAVIAADRTLSYRELDTWATATAAQLTELGARPGSLVAVVMHKGWEQVVAALGVVRSGAAYLPVDAGLPPARVEQLLRAGRVSIAVTQPGVRLSSTVTPVVVAGDPPATPADPPPGRPATPQDLAYVIFTSGSTGEPKGVMIDHRGAVNTLHDINQRFSVGPGDRVLGLSSLNFDLSVYDVFGVLGAGGALVLPAPGEARDPGRWADLVAEHGVTLWNTVPALLDLYVETAERRGLRLPESLRLVMLSGDWIPLALPGRLRAVAAREPQLISLGGATEASIWSIGYPVGAVDPQWRSVPYGTPLRNQTFHVFDDQLAPRPDHVPGELYIGGVGVALGYWDDPERTAERFPVHPVTNERLYRTGDLGRYLPDGTIEFLGREDFQVKIGGHRIELGEIESVLSRHPAVQSAVVNAVGEGRQRLVAYLLWQPGDTPDDPGGAGTDPAAQRDPDAVRDFAAEQLPGYMVPGQFVTLDRLPLSPNGKVNRALLPVPEAKATGAGEAPANDAERAMAEVWRSVLPGVSPGRHDDFFELGGDSLLGVRALARAAEQGLHLTPQEFFAHRTIAAQAARARAVPAHHAPQEQLTGTMGLTPSQRWFFEQRFARQDHWNGMWPVFVVDTPLDTDLLAEALRHVLRHHDALRARYAVDGSGEWSADLLGDEALTVPAVHTVDLSAVPDGDLDDEISRHTARQNGSLSLSEGPTIRLTCFDTGPHRPHRLLISAHWLVMDYYSSRVFYEDLRAVYFQLEAGEDISLPLKSASLRQAVERLTEAAGSRDVTAQLPLWRTFAAHPAPPVPRDLAGENSQASAERYFSTVTGATAEAVLQTLPRRFGVEVREVLLTALLRTVTQWTGESDLLVDIEGHGREPLFGDLDLSRTIGRLSTLSPLLLRRADTGHAVDELLAVRDQVREVPYRGAGYGVLRYLHPDPEVRRSVTPQLPPDVGFNFWGDVTEYFTGDARPVEDSFGHHRSPAGHRPRALDVMALAAGGEIRLVWTYSTNLHHEATIAALASGVIAQLDQLADQSHHRRENTP